MWLRSLSTMTARHISFVFAKKGAPEGGNMKRMKQLTLHKIDDANYEVDGLPEPQEAIIRKHGKLKAANLSAEEFRAMKRKGKVSWAFHYSPSGFLEGENHESVFVKRGFK